QTARRYPLDRPLYSLIEEQVDRTPDATAVVFEEERLTFQELDARANRLAHYLRSLGVKENSLVSVAMKRSVEMVVSLVAILKAGAAYVPMDPEYPPDRIAYMLEDSNTAVLLTQQRVREKLPANDSRVLAVDNIADQLERQSPERLAVAATPEDLAYMIYTSG